MIGNRYDGELMVIGRSLNGWDTTLLPSEVYDDKQVEDVAKRVLKGVTGTSGNCPMCWVSEYWGCDEDYNTARSAFWRVIRSVVDQLGLADVKSLDWPSYLTWSNLYKLSPSAGGNPGATLSSLQLEHCKELLSVELKERNPKRVLFLTGFDWISPFLDGWAKNLHRVPGYSFVEAIAVSNWDSATSGKVVVACHPQGKNESLWVKEVIEAFTGSAPT